MKVKNNMNRYNNIFTKMYPHIDLHGETTDTCIAPLNEFITDNLRLHNAKVVVIHGIGEGILKTRVHELLKKDNRVKKFYLDCWNIGETIIELKIDN